MLDNFLIFGNILRNRILYDIYKNVDYFEFFRNKLEFEKNKKIINNKLINKK